MLLFDTFLFLLFVIFENDSITHTDLADLINRNGGVLVKKAKEFSDKKSRIVLFEEEKWAHINVKNANMMLETAEIHSLMVTWFLDSLACFQIKEFNHYALYNVHPIKE
jgi:hypothetical protein